MLRIISGKHRGKKLLSPPEALTRPTLDRVRECLFSSLLSMRSLQGAHVVDAFAGSGAFGLEALSRGAAAATFIEHNPVVYNYLKRNVSLVSDARSHVILGDSLLHLPTLNPVDILFLDPPYNSTLAEELLQLNLPLAEGAIIIIETDKKEMPFHRFTLLKEKKVGRARLLFLEKK